MENQLTLASPNIWANDLSLFSQFCPLVDSTVLILLGGPHAFTDLLMLQYWNYKYLFSLCLINLKVLIKIKNHIPHLLLLKLNYLES